jgi:UPF0755 protein
MPTPVKHRFLKFCAAVVATAGLCMGVGFLLLSGLKHYSQAPVDSDSGIANASDFTIAPGDSFRSITRRLTDMGIIHSPLKFRLLARLQKQDKRIKAGEYRLSSNLAPGEILAKFTNGEVILHQLTVPEGYNLEQIAQSAATAGFAKADDFLAAANDPKLIESLEIDAPSLEGYLFPDTYHFPRAIDPAKIIGTMVRELKSTFTPAWEAAARQSGFTLHEVLTLASIIEKETGDPAERALISSVFHNRLKKRMRLETDPTVIYGIPNFDGNLTRKHLHTPGPYNTYLNTGLPPGPIASPGAEAIKAALFPEKTDYLFFVSKKDGTHHFSTHLTAHNRAVKKYQLTR